MSSGRAFSVIPSSKCWPLIISVCFQVVCAPFFVHPPKRYYLAARADRVTVVLCLRSHAVVYDLRSE